MLTYTGYSPPPGRRLFRRGTCRAAVGLTPRLIPLLLLGLGTSCSALWQPWIASFDRSCGELGGACATAPTCDGGAAPCGASDMPPGETPDMSPAACGLRLPPSAIYFSAQTSSVTNYLRSVWGSDPTHVWAVGDGGAVVKWNGNAWTKQDSKTAKALLAVWGSSATELVAAGEGGTVTISDGSNWTAYDNLAMNTIYGVWGKGNIQNFWAVGSIENTPGGFVVNYNGAFLVPVLSASGLSSIWGVDDSTLWATGGGGYIFKRTGTQWSSATFGTGTGLSSVWGLDATHVWAVGDTGTIIKWDGHSWTKQNSGTSAPLYAVWGSDPCNIWAVGFQGAIVKWDGATWSPQTSGMNSHLGGVWGSDARNVWMVGDHGTILHLDVP